MKFVFFVFLLFYLGVLVYFYLTQDSKIFKPNDIEKREPVEVKNMKNISLHVNGNATLYGVYRKADKNDAKLILYFGGNSDDATRILLHVKSLKEFDFIAFNYRGFVKSSGKPTQKALFSDALEIYDKYTKDKDVIVIGRSLGTGVASYLASKRKVKGVVLITPYDSIASMGKEKYPYLPIYMLLKHKFESVKYIQNVNTPIGLIEVKNDEVIIKSHFDKFKAKVKNIALHVVLENTTHGEVLTHPNFEITIRKMINVM
jgi:pimeloyl-ACP methyl ester carboxylesterase